ncbi:hypothetical protein, partial [Myroides odoratimimus]|uniref:hypothetical protein n=1 Tax=Myroides odoratimimus TaxID=76832 RepID=UPI003100C930
FRWSLSTGITWSLSPESTSISFTKKIGNNYLRQVGIKFMLFGIKKDKTNFIFYLFVSVSSLTYLLRYEQYFSI